MSRDGVLTVALADALRPVYEPKGYRILSDHGNKSRDDVGNIVSSLGRPGFGTELGQLDLAVVDGHVCAVVALIELEEGSDRPKTILGDVFATLLGSQVAFDGEPLTIDERTTLIILVPEVTAHRKRIEALATAVTRCRPSGAGNAAIREVRILTFRRKDGPLGRAHAAIDAAISAARSVRDTTEEKLQALLQFVKDDGRICPIPACWHQLWDMLPEKTKSPSGWEPAPPLILAAWVGTPMLLKQQRLEEHIRYGAAHGVLHKVDAFLRGLCREEWYCAN